MAPSNSELLIPEFCDSSSEDSIKRCGYELFVVLFFPEETFLSTSTARPSIIRAE